jgi:hypothetical protein
MRPMKFSKVSAWDVAYAVDLAIACLITYWVTIFLLPHLVDWPSTSVGVLWAVISTVFVYKDTRVHSLSAGISRLIATFASFALCLNLFLAIARDDSWHGGVDRDRRAANDPHRPAR